MATTKHGTERLWIYMYTQSDPSTYSNAILMRSHIVTSRPCLAFVRSHCIIHPFDQSEAKKKKEKKNNIFITKFMHILSFAVALRAYSTITHTIAHMCDIYMPLLLCTNSIDSLCRMNDKREKERRTNGGREGRNGEKFLVFHLIIAICERTQYIKPFRHCVRADCCTVNTYSRAHVCMCTTMAASCAMQNNEPTRLGESVALNHILFCTNDFIPRLSDNRLLYTYISHYINEAIERTQKHRSYSCAHRVSFCQRNIWFDIFELTIEMPKSDENQFDRFRCAKIFRSRNFRRRHSVTILRLLLWKSLLLLLLLLRLWLSVVSFYASSIFFVRSRSLASSSPRSHRLDIIVLRVPDE